ncbi:MAG: hypothetical protein FJX00_01370 [Alphaproteobacteria bacterium]|nr:hypothetical protein [Alphaproteobacteria bacterium]
MQELLLLTLFSVLSPMSISCTDQEETEQVDDQSSGAESAPEETVEQGDNSQTAQGETSQEATAEASPPANDFDFSGSEVNSTHNETGEKSIFDADTFEATGEV